MTAQIPEQAVTAAAATLREHLVPDATPEDMAVLRETATSVLEVAARAIIDQAAQAERERVAHLERLLAGERRQWTTALADHYLMSVECDAERKLDNPVCGCSRVFLGWHPSIGEARQAWIGHVDQVVASATVMETLTVADRVAELEALAAEMYRYIDGSYVTEHLGPWPDVSQRWEAILKGQHG